MKTKTRQGLLRFPLSLLYGGNYYYIERVKALEKAVAKKPRRLQLDLTGGGEIPDDWALLIRSILNWRSPGTQLITNARSSLRNGSVLVWLLGERRLIREDAGIFFRRANLGSDDAVPSWKDFEKNSSEVDPDEIDHAKVLELINEFLPVNEFIGKPVEMPLLRQFGLVENEKFDQFLASAFGPTPADGEKMADTSKEIPAKSSSTSIQK